MRLVLLGLKGGLGKTFSAVYWANELATRGRTLLVDTDPQGSTLRWSDRAEFDFPCIAAPTSDLRKRLGMMAEDYDYLVLDTPPGNRGIARSALLAADTVVVPIPPTTVDLDRLRPTLELVEEVSPELPLFVLLTKVGRGTRSARAIRITLEKLHLRVLKAEIPRRESYSLAWGNATREPGKSDYRAALEELLKEREQYGQQDQ